MARYVIPIDNNFKGNLTRSVILNEVKDLVTLLYTKTVMEKAIPT